MRVALPGTIRSAFLIVLVLLIVLPGLAVVVDSGTAKRAAASFILGDGAVRTGRADAQPEVPNAELYGTLHATELTEKGAPIWGIMQLGKMFWVLEFQALKDVSQQGNGDLGSCRLLLGRDPGGAICSLGGAHRRKRCSIVR